MYFFLLFFFYNIAEFFRCEDFGLTTPVLAPGFFEATVAILVMNFTDRILIPT